MCTNLTDPFVSLLLSENSPMIQAGLWVFRLISRAWLSRSESRLHPAPITRVGGRPLCLQATCVMMSTGIWQEKEQSLTISKKVNEQTGEECLYHQHQPGWEAMSIIALGLRRARFGMIPLYKSTFVWTTLTYDCSLLHAFAVTTTTLEPAEADKSNEEEWSSVKFCTHLTANLVGKQFLVLC